LKFAAIDIGSNAIRLLIGEVLEINNKVHISKLSLIRLPIRLGSDVFNDGRISPEKEERFIQGMEAFKIIMNIHNVEGYKAYATSAMRTAENGLEVAEKILNKTGIDIRIIDGNEEADLILSTFHLLGLDDNTPYLYIDVGGGSTEISLLIDGKAKASHSFQIGTVRMLQNSVKEGEWDDMLSWVDLLKEKYHPQLAIGSGGNINKIIKLCCSDDEIEMNIELMRSLLVEMEKVSIQERMERWDLRSDRADVIVHASSIYLNVMDHAGIDTILIPKIGLADGILYRLYKEASSKIN
jgi:exopolyphosphatase/guanosine-5'-triphosphate,3'-diphosphate pyrophosphatase